jgi:hypothetical protein
VSKEAEIASSTPEAIQSIYSEDEKTLSEEWSHVLRDKSLLEIEAYDITLLKLLSKGFIIDEISSVKNSGIIPNGSSSIEKRINKLKIYLKLTMHLI